MAIDRALQDALTDGDFDAARAMLGQVQWEREPGFLDAVDLVADVFMTIEPQATAALLQRRLEYTLDAEEWRSVEIRRIDALCRAGLLDEARLVFAEFQPQVESVADRVERDTLFSNIAAFFQRAGALSTARSILHAIVEANRDLDPTASSPERARLMAVALLNLATVEAHPAAGNLDDALDLLDEAERFARSNSTTLGNIAYNRGFVHVQRGDITAADNAYGEAAAVFRRAGADPIDLAYVLRGRAGLLGRVGRIDEAARLYEEAIQTFLGEGVFDEAARTDIGLLMAQAVAGESITTERVAASRARLSEAAPTDLPELLMNVGNIEVINGSNESAYETFASSRRLFRRSDRWVDAARADLARAVVLRRLGRMSHALRVTLRAREVFDEARRSQLVAHADNNLAVIFDALGREAEAIDAAINSLAELDRHRHRLPTAHDRLTVGTVTYPNVFNLAFAITSGHGDLQAALIERSRIQPRPDRSNPGGDTLEIPPPVAARPGAKVVPGRGSVRYLIEAGGLSNPRHRLSWVFTDDSLLRCHLTPEVTHVDRVPLNHRLLGQLELCLARPTTDDLESSKDLEVARRVALFRAAKGPLLNDQDLAERLAPTLLHADRQRVLELDLGSAESLLVELSQWLLPPTLINALAYEENLDPTVVVAPPSALGRVPWASLIVNDRCLIQTAALQADLPVALRTSDDGSVEPPVGGTGLWVGDPSGDLRYCRRAPGEHWEVLTSSSDPSATRSAVLGALRSRPAVFVYRGHVVPGPATDPAASHMVLADSTMLRAADLRHERLGASLCLLLGCDSSGATSGVEWTGIATGFIWAGARDVVTTQWEVIDRPAQETFDAALIRSCLQDGATNGLRRWQREHADAWQRRSSDVGPYVWANPIVVSSRPRTLVFNDDRLDIGDDELVRLSSAIG